MTQRVANNTATTRLWSEYRNQSKFLRMLPFGEALPLIRDQVGRDLALPGLPREKVLAVVVRLLESTFIRIGNRGVRPPEQFFWAHYVARPAR